MTAELAWRRQAANVRFGPLADIEARQPDVRLPPKAEVNHNDGNVRFVPKADQVRRNNQHSYSITSSARS
jgi:hypothetical protein